MIVNIRSILVYQLAVLVNFKYISLICLGLVKVILTQKQACNAYKCKTLGNNACMKPETGVEKTIDLEECQSYNYCNFDKTSSLGNCEKTTYLSGQFIGGPCNTPADCRENQATCIDNKCTFATPTCTDDYSCAIGQFCGNKNETLTCVPQVAIGENCTKTSECVNTAMCRKSTSKCVEALTLEDGEAALFEERFLCKSGFSLDSKCSRAVLKSEGVCDSVCTYSYNGTETNSSSACVCGMNSNGDKYCNYGYNSTEHDTVMDLKTRYLNKNNSVACHTSERFTPCISQAFDKQGGNVTHHAFR